jgi:hypothetical protein
MPSSDPEKLRANQRRKFARRRLTVLRAYSNGQEPFCSCCGEAQIEFLCIDHIDGGGTRHRNGIAKGTGFYSYLLRAGFPPGYRVLCHNCNLSLGYYGYCPHADSEKSAVRAALALPQVCVQLKTEV